jgi:hypothetical protein
MIFVVRQHRMLSSDATVHTWTQKQKKLVSADFSPTAPRRVNSNLSPSALSQTGARADQKLHLKK